METSPTRSPARTSPPSFSTSSPARSTTTRPSRSPPPDSNAIPKPPIPHKDLLIAPIAEAALLLAVGAVGLLAHRPLLFASLGPTAYELVETPMRPSARPYNILVGHSLGVLSGFLALFLLPVKTAAPVTLRGGLSTPRMEAAALAATLTVFLTLLLRAMQPAAVSTTLLIALGSMDRWQDAALILSSVLLLTLLGELIRRWRLRSSPSYTEANFARTTAALNATRRPT